jgi:outer membrane protein OmpA-like peptidoglycan-associated protein
MEILKIMLSEQMGDSVMIRQPEEGLLLVFDSDRLFKQGLEYVNDSSTETLHVLATSLQRFPNTRLYILVHTDNSSSEFIALSLSDKRAKNIKKILASKGMKRSHIVAEGRGFTVPVISNESPEGRKLNRRVEMAVTANHKMIRQAIKSTKTKR